MTHLGARVLTGVILGFTCNRALLLLLHLLDVSLRLRADRVGDLLGLTRLLLALSVSLWRLLLLLLLRLLLLLLLRLLQLLLLLSLLRHHFWRWRHPLDHFTSFTSISHASHYSTRMILEELWVIHVELLNYFTTRSSQDLRGEHIKGDDAILA